MSPWLYKCHVLKIKPAVQTVIHVCVCVNTRPHFVTLINTHKLVPHQTESDTQQRWADAFTHGKKNKNHTVAFSARSARFRCSAGRRGEDSLPLPWWHSLLQLERRSRKTSWRDRGEQSSSGSSSQNLTSCRPCFTFPLLFPSSHANFLRRSQSLCCHLSYFAEQLSSFLLICLFSVAYS